MHHTMTRDEYDEYVATHGFPPFGRPQPGERHRYERNRLSNHNHEHHTRGIG